MLDHVVHLALIYLKLHSQLIIANCRQTILQSVHCSHTTSTEIIKTIRTCMTINKHETSKTSGTLGKGDILTWKNKNEKVDLKANRKHLKNLKR